MTDEQGRTHPYTSEARLLRSGEYASVRQNSPDVQLAYLAHPQRSILARRDSPDRAWEVEDQSKRTPVQSHYVALNRIDDFIAAAAAPLAAMSRDHMATGLPKTLTVTRLEHFEENGRPRVRVRIEDGSPIEGGQWRTATYVLAADDLYALQSAHFEGCKPGQANRAIGIQIRPA